jgi:ssDNA-binding Zn-finger/Zn-ribbon topoisomerase 1
MKLSCCPFDKNSKLRQVGIEGSSAQECPQCKQIFVVRSREDGKFFECAIYIYSDVMHAASECPLEFQTSMF